MRCNPLTINGKNTQKSQPNTEKFQILKLTKNQFNPLIN